MFIKWALALVLSIFLMACGNDKSVEQEPENRCESEQTDSGYCLVWSDEFDQQSLDLTKWSYERNCWGGGNNEAQCYVDRSKNIWLEDSMLHIKAIREDTVGPGMGDDQANYNSEDTSGSGTYSSARIRTKNKADWRYGRFEIRAKLPEGQGTWPAIWMLPTDWVYGGWASSGEIDIMEAVNLKVGGENHIHGTLHFGADFPENVYAGEPYALPNGQNPADGFHEYAIEWEQGEIRWYVDGDHFATQTSDGWYSANALDNPYAPFDQTFHLILNLAVGGNWAGQVNDTGIDETVFPQEMVVDYVRVYECGADPETGKGCATFDDRYVMNPGVTPPLEIELPEDGLEWNLYSAGELAENYFWESWVVDGSISLETKSVDGRQSTVEEIRFETNEGIAYIQSSSATDFSRFTHLAFDLRIVADSREVKSPLSLRLDCIFPCTSGNYPLQYPEGAEWKRYTVSIQSLINMGLDISNVNTPFAITSETNNLAGLVVQVDKVVFHSP